MSSGLRAVATWSVVAVAIAGLPFASAQDASSEPEPLLPKPSAAAATGTSLTNEGSADRTQTPKAAGTASAGESAITPESVQQALADLKAEEAVDPAVKTKAEAVYAQALATLVKAEESRTAVQAYSGMTAEFVTEAVKALQQKLEAKSVVEPLGEVKDLSLDALNDRLAQMRERLEAAITKATTTREEIASRLRNRDSIAKRIETNASDSAKVVESLAAPPPPGESPEVTQANRALLLARQAALEAERKQLAAEIPYYNRTDQLLTLRQKLGDRVVKELSDQIARLESQRRALEQQQRAEQVAEAQEVVSDADPLLKPEAEANETLARQLQGPESFAEQTAAVEKASVKAQARLTELKTEKQRVEEQLSEPDMEDVMGPRLLRLRRTLPALQVIEQRMRKRSEIANEARLAQFEDREQLETLPTPSRLVNAALAGINEPVTDKRRQALLDQAETIVDTRRELLTAEVEDADELLKAIYEANERDQRLLNLVRDYREVIDERILWVRSTDRISLATLTTATRGFAWMFSAENWSPLLEAIRADITSNPVLWVVSAVGFLLYWYTRRRMRHRLRDLDRLVRANRLQPSRYTLLAFGLNLLIAALWPLLLIFVGWRLRTAATETFARASGAALFWTASFGFVLEALRRICRRGGLAEVHFRWRPKQLSSMVWTLRWLILIGLPCVFVVALFESQDDYTYAESLGRLALICGLLVLATLLGYASWFRGTGAAPSASKTSPATDADVSVAAAPKAEEPPSAWFKLTRVLSIGFPLLFAGLAAIGYYFTALELTHRLLLTVGLIVGLALLKALVMRWLFVIRGKLAIQQIKAAEAVRQAGPDEEDAPTTEMRKEAKLQQFDLAGINQQTRQFVRIGLVVATVVGLYAIWSSVLPALSLFDFELWTSIETVSQVNEETGLYETSPVVEVITFRSLLLAVAVVFVAFYASRNLPGLLEVSLLQRLPFDLGTRDAISTVLRSLLLIFGLLWASGTVGLHWSQVQWLVAAIGVGVGFGMQEVVANFICGLILMFERPIRIGDIVTVDDVTGVVTRVRIRATTVRNWDRKEFIVPNKELITGRLLNWTLSDSVNRIVIEVGVAYGSDTELARQTLYRIVTEHPLILDDPAPIVVFEGFGDSTLNFVVRCFIEGYDPRLKTIDELHSRIDYAFREAGIEIAFPQRDLHLRTSDVTLGPSQTSSGQIADSSAPESSEATTA